MTSAIAVATYCANDQVQSRVEMVFAALGSSATLSHVATGGRAPGDVDVFLVAESVRPAEIHALRSRHPKTLLIALGCSRSVDAVVAAMRSGVDDYVCLDICDSELCARLAEYAGVAFAASNARRDEGATAAGWIGTSRAARQIWEMVRRVSHSRSTVLIGGETGTGKEVIAASVHRLSERSKQPLISLNCAAIPDTMIEGELFGYQKGAFTGARSAFPGKFRLADKGTLFLDEVGDLSLAAQAKLLRAIESREICGIGASHPVSVDVRIVAASNLDLAEQVKRGAFRADLFFRLAVVRLQLPTLGQRREDILPIARHLLRIICRDNGMDEPILLPCLCAALEAHAWPGNVRELRNAIEHAMITAMDRRSLGAQDLPEHLSRLHDIPVGSDAQTLEPSGERLLLLETLRQCAGSKTAAARQLNCSRMTLYRRLERAGLGDPALHEPVGLPPMPCVTGSVTPPVTSVTAAL